MAFPNTLPSANDHSIWGALIRLVQRDMRGAKMPKYTYQQVGDEAGRHHRAAAMGMGSFDNAVNAYNRANRSKLPHLNVFVVNQARGIAPGRPKGRPSADKVWSSLQADPDLLLRLLTFLYRDGPTRTRRLASIPTSHDKPGAASGGIRSEATWSARHSPLTRSVDKRLRRLGWIPYGYCHEHADLAGQKDGKILITEVKPQSTTHNVITAIGQLAVYSRATPEALRAFAAPGPLPKDQYLTLAMADLSILFLDTTHKERWAISLMKREDEPGNCCYDIPLHRSAN